MSTVIKLENISKQYRLGSIGTNTLKGDMQRWWYNMRGLPDPTLKIGQENTLSKPSSGKQLKEDYIWALKDINFDVQQGEVLGIIGKNGAGKSTLLKLLSRVTAPTTGNINIKGRIASLLEVGTGFHPDLTGRENIFLNGAILGMRKIEIQSKLDEIVDFAGVTKYLDTPVKRYSSGMYVRLAFAVAAHLEPEILIVDEVLAVGDAEFQKKAIGKMQDVSKEKGRTVLFVSHNMRAIKSLCKTSIYLDQGMIRLKGETNTLIESYMNQDTNKERVYYPTDNIVTKISASQLDDKIILKLNYSSREYIKQPNFGFILYDNYDTPIFGTNPIMNGVTTFGPPKNEGEVVVTITSPFLVDGIYPISVWFSDGNGHEGHYFIKEKCISIKISNMNNSFIEKPPLLGPIVPICGWEFF